MHVVLSTYDSRGGVEPLAALASHLRAAGHEATVCAPPDCAARLEELGVPHVQIGASVQALVHGATPPAPTSIPARAAEIMRSQLSQLLPAARGCDVLVGSGLMPSVAGARSVAEKLGVPFVFLSYCPIYLPSRHQPPQPMPLHPFPPGVTDHAVLSEHVRLSYDALFRDGLDAARASAGMPPVDHVRDHVLSAHSWVAADPVLAPLVPDVDALQTGAWLVKDERPLPSALQRFLDAGDPPVLVTFGSMRPPADAAAVARDAARALGRRLVLGSGWAGLTAEGGDCFVVGEVNQQALFRRVAAVVHHGGAGTTTTAALAGVPQVVVPQVGDQPYWASRVAALGIGVAHDGSVPTVDSLTEALSRALPLGDRAREVSRSIRTDGVEVATGALVALSR